MVANRPRFDVVVVGAGPAGTAAAYTLAKAGVEVLLLERGPYPGSKNTFGGILYRQPMEELIPEFWKDPDCPIERKVIGKEFWLMTKDSAIIFGHRKNVVSDGEYNGFTTLRAKFDQWFAEKAQAAGAMLINGTTVVDVIRENGRQDSSSRIVGVRTDREQGDVYTDVVIAADGVNSLLSKKAGLHDEIPTANVALAVKEIIQLTEADIRARFRLEGDDGIEIVLLGEITKGMVGGGFIYTNRDTVSVGIACTASDFVATGVSPAELIEEVKAHPMVRPLIEGGQLREYQAHLIPEGGYDAIPPLYTDGYLVVGDAAMLVNTVFFEGANHAFNSGRLAAETVLEARAKGDFSASTLSAYQRRLGQSITGKDLKNLRGMPSFLHKHKEFFTMYPSLATEAIHDLLYVDGVTKKEKIRSVIKQVLARRPLWGLAKDMWDAWRTIS